MDSSFDKLQELLAKEKFPHLFTYKVVGKNTPAFLQAAAALEADFPELKFTEKRDSSKGNHVSVTLTLNAKGPEDIVKVYRRLQALPDVILML